ncbi:MAG: response regulator [Pseudomonadota bacterium]
MSRILTLAGHEVTVARTGAEAVDLITEGTFDLVLMDLNMPEMDGIEAVKMLRFMNDPNELAPIIALSADATPETIEACRQAGFSDYLTKPIDNARLIERIDEIVSLHKDDMQAAQQEVSTADKAAATARHQVVVQPVVQRPSEPLEAKNLEALRQLDSGDGFFASILKDYLEDTAETIDHLEEAAAQGDARNFRDLIHALKSSSAHIGAKAIVDLTLEWRHLDDHALMMRAPVEVARLRRCLDQVRIAMNAYLDPVTPVKPLSRIRPSDQHDPSPSNTEQA